jgi:RNase P protein component
VILRILRTEDFQKIRNSGRNFHSSQTSNILGSLTCNGRIQGCWCNEDGADVCSYAGWFRFKFRPSSRHSVEVSRITVHLNIVI